MEMITAALFGLGSMLMTLVFVAVGIAAGWKVCSKAGYHGAWSLITLIPFVNFIAILYFAFTEWPLEAELKKLKGE